MRPSPLSQPRGSHVTRVALICLQAVAIVSIMLSGRILSPRRVLALAILFVLLSPAIISVASPLQTLEQCAACPECADGGCGDQERPLPSHEHCCQTSCSAHTVWLVKAISAPSPPAAADAALARTASPGPLQSPSPIYHPPRA
jgi:hypothetical protein